MNSTLSFIRMNDRLTSGFYCMGCGSPLVRLAKHLTELPARCEAMPSRPGKTRRAPSLYAGIVYWGAMVYGRMGTAWHKYAPPPPPALTYRKRSAVHISLGNDTCEECKLELREERRTHCQGLLR